VGGFGRTGERPSFLAEGAVTARKDDAAAADQASTSKVTVSLWRDEPDNFRLTPTARGTCPSPWMEFPDLRINLNSPAVFADFQSLAIVTLNGRHKFDAAVAMPITLSHLCIT